MSNLNYSRGKFFLTDGEQNLLLLDARTSEIVARLNYLLYGGDAS